MLLDYADTIGVTIEYTRLPADRDGVYDHEARRIRLRRGMSARHHRSVLAHELGHAAFGDTPTHFGPVHAKQERRAEEWAALRLIDIDEYRHLEAVHAGHPGAIAVDLDVMRSTVIAFQNLIERLGNTVYVQPRMGAGQWAHRERTA
ncbi:Zn-dependent peptidase ImmA (M78 family) [Microbacterium testaceum]|uniref:ImmA/IrrE family metallo-endopeptidase n=1 Tax=Microbacterium TaxID=33882 RepID=UPI00277EBBFF|nr:MULTISPECIES: ImmA/IrrE family metallo-endopeptidase [Microbacterium]MDQ1111090.1 Zn-dependent peptidase ImmA (M78 family) [Microbacterium testaceum]MDR6098368.1 Zn-dependent peptidase ImmA (M78 family) [Microbacterium sp. SORGH_AS_0454]